MRKPALLLLLLLTTGCSTGIVVHDEARAAELIVDFLSALKTDEGIELSYAWTDDKFKERVSASEFWRMVAIIRERNEGARIRLGGYEIFGPVETINLYASSAAAAGKLYFKFILVGSKAKDYYLLNLDVNESGFEKKGRFEKYRRTITVEGV